MTNHELPCPVSVTDANGNKLYCEQEGEHKEHAGERTQEEYDTLVAAWRKRHGKMDG